MGKPAGTKEVNAALFLGWFNQVDDWWRVSGGVQVTLPQDSGTKRIELSFPAMFSLAATALDYKGAIRIGPSIVWSTPQDKPTTVSYGVTLEILGQRLLFSQDFDKL